MQACSNVLRHKLLCARSCGCSETTSWLGQRLPGKPRFHTFYQSSPYRAQVLSAVQLDIADSDTISRDEYV